jgi:asparagine synthase (glutamine-hydrolysing)
LSHSDTEVILVAFKEWGEDCVLHLDGMFAFAIWQVDSQTLFLARDRLGIKPLYFSLNAHHFRFASNMQALLAAGEVDKQIDPVALHYQLTLHAVVPAPNTILQGIRKLEPATWLRINTRGQQQQQRYWQLWAERPLVHYNEHDWRALLHQSLSEAVKKRMLAADVPVGVLLSGGLDSSLLVGLLAEAGTKNVHTFSIGFENQPEEEGNEFKYSDWVAQHFATQHQKYLIPNDAVLKRLPEAVAAMAEPMVGQDAVAFYLLSEQVAQNVKVVLSGQGADEVFAGYFWYPQMHHAQGDVLQRFAPYYFDRPHGEFLQTVMPHYHGDDHSSVLVQQRLTESHADRFLDQVLRFDVTTLIVDDPVKRVDNMTMAWGLEARVPFLDTALVELAASMPPELKLKQQGKYPLKALARGLIPDAVIDRPKAYFPVPALKYVRGEFLSFMRDILNSRACRQRGLWQADYIERLLAAPEQYMTALQGSKLWHTALLELWLQTHVD